MAKKILDPIHPGEILLEEFLEPMGLGQSRLAGDLSAPPRRINGSCTASAGSPSTPLSGSPVCSGRRRASGSTSSRATTSRSRLTVNARSKACGPFERALPPITTNGRPYPLSLRRLDGLVVIVPNRRCIGAFLESLFQVRGIINPQLFRVE